MIPNPLVLAVDDETGILRLLKQEMEPLGFHVITAAGGTEALRIAETQRPDIVLLDVFMPGMAGPEVMKRLKERSDMPVIYLSGTDRDRDKVAALDDGADDYVIKPFSVDEVAARIRAVLRRRIGGLSSGPIFGGGVEIDLSRRLVRRNGEMVHLSRTEFLVLQQLAANPGRVILISEMLSSVWGPEYRDDVQYLRVWVSRLRRRLEEDPANPTLIRTVPGIGYILDAEVGREATAPA